jgi:hypothetical protein
LSHPMDDNQERIAGRGIQSSKKSKVTILSKARPL